MRALLWVGVATAVLAASCTFKAGNGDFDASFFDRGHDASLKDAGKRPDAARPRHDAATAARARDEDGGHEDARVRDAGHTPTPDDIPALFAQTVCSALETCLQGPVLLLDLLGGVPCVDLVTHQQTDRDLHWLAESIKAGRVLFRPARFADCLADLKAFGCEVRSRRLPQSCEDAIEGQVALHQACSIDYDCAGGAYCDKGLTTETCPGSCSTPQPEGLPCKASAECDDHLVCIGGSCVALLKEADSCETSACPPGLVCLGKPGSRKCQSLGAYAGKLGDSCDAYGPLCQAGLVCESQSASNTAGTCKKPVAKDADCKRALPNECPSTQYCKSAQSSSIARAQPGEVGICTDLPPDGGSCKVLSCAPGTVCVNEICRAMKSLGDACTSADECYSQHCELGTCVPTLDCQL
jgi:hypothetical protein